MKKIILFVFFALTGFSSFALDSTVCGPSGGPYTAGACKTTTNCANPNNGFSDVTGYTCFYTDSPQNGRFSICPYLATGAHYTDHAVINCYSSTSAPVNAGLIFLIIAGGGLGVFMFKKHGNKLNSSLVA